MRRLIRCCETSVWGSRLAISSSSWRSALTGTTCPSDHVPFLVQSAPTYSVTKLVTTIKSLTAREIFRHCPQVKRQLWGGEFWTDGSCASTVGRHGNEAMISDYVKKQGRDYQKLHENRQLALF